MGYKKSYGTIDTQIAEQRRTEIREEYGVNGTSLNRIFSFYKYNTHLLGQVEDTIEYLIDMFDVYGKTREEAIDYINANHNIATVSSDSMNKKLAILHQEGLDEEVLFERPGCLQRDKVSDLFASIEDIKEAKQDVNASTIGSYSFIDEEQKIALRRLHPLYKKDMQHMEFEYEQFKKESKENRSKLVLE